MVSRNDGRKPSTDGPKKGNRAETFRDRVTCQLQHRVAPFYVPRRIRGCGTAMIGNVVNDGRLFSLQAAEWLMLIAGG